MVEYTRKGMVEVIWIRDEHVEDTIFLDFFRYGGE